MKIQRLLLAVLMIAGLSGAASAAEIQCKRILKYLSTGRSPSDIAETMVVSEDDVLACQEEAEAGGGDDAKDAGAEDAKE